MFPRTIVFITLLIMSLTGFSRKSYGESIDKLWLLEINRRNTPFLDDYFNGVTISLYPVGVGAPAAMLVYGWKKNDPDIYDSALVMESSFLITMTMNTALKFVVNKEHPYEVYSEVRKVKGDITSSFPSGHAAGSFCFALVSSLEFPKWYAIIPSYLWAFANSYGRIYQGIHFPSDILAGIIEGTVIGLLFYENRDSVIKIFKRIGFYPQISSEKTAMLVVLTF